MEQQAKHNLAIAAGLVFAGLALAGCGGSGADTRADRADAAVGGLQQQIAELQATLDQAQTDLSTAQSERDQARTALETADRNLQAARDSVNSLTQQLNAARDNVNSLTQQLSAAQDRVDSLTQQLSDAQNDDAADDAEIQRLTNALGLAETQRDTARMERDQAQDLLDAANLEIAGLRQQLEAAEADRRRIMEEAAAAAATAEAKKVDKAIEANAGMAPTIALAASTTGNLRATATGYTTSATMPGAIAGWRSVRLEKGDDVAVVYTNIENATATLLEDLYSSMQPAGEPKTYNVNDPADSENSIPWSVVTRTNTAVIRTGGTGNEVFSFAGAVQGLPGTFSCSGLGCVAPSRQEDGSVPDSSSEEGWSFRPTNPSGRVAVPDSGYLSFGWWLGEDGDDYLFDAFARAHGDGLPAGYSVGAGDIAGTATYRGAAAGKYAMRSLTEDSVSAGDFTASVSLTADFDHDDTSTTNTVEDEFSLSGTVSDFMSDGASLGNWQIALGQGSAMGSVESFTTGIATWSTGGAQDGTGSWSAEFHGDPGTDNDPPAAITGEFAASVGSVQRIRGAYAAMKE